MSYSASSFLKQAGKILNSGQARTLLLTGNIHDLFFKKEDEIEDYVPLLPFLVHHWDVPNFILIIHELNGPIRFLHEAHAELMKRAWVEWRTGSNCEELAIQRMLNKGRDIKDLHDIETEFDQHLQKAVGKPTLALELLTDMSGKWTFHVPGEATLRSTTSQIMPVWTQFSRSKVTLSVFRKDAEDLDRRIRLFGASAVASS